ASWRSGRLSAPTPGRPFSGQLPPCRADSAKPENVARSRTALRPEETGPGGNQHAVDGTRPQFNGWEGARWGASMRLARSASPKLSEPLLGLLNRLHADTADHLQLLVCACWMRTFQQRHSRLSKVVAQLFASFSSV